MKNQHMMSLILYRTFFVVKIHDKKLENPLNVVLYGLKTYTFVWNKWYKKMMRKEDKSYYSYDQVDKSYRFPICMLKEVMGTFGRYGVQKEDIFLFRKYNTGIEKLNLKFNTKDFTLRDYQQQYSDILVNERTSKPVLLVDLETGKGKFLENNTKIRIPNGWKRIGDIKVGDKVMAPDGTYTIVDGVYPQGEKDLYKITFYDGRTIRCGGEHLWYVYKYDKWYVTDTYDLYSAVNSYNYFKCGGSPLLYIPLITPEKNETKDFFIHPYVLGCIIGDGGISTSVIKLHIHDQETIDKVKYLIHEDYELKEFTSIRPNGSIEMSQSIVIKNKHKMKINKYKTELERLGLMYKTSLEKFIPEEYLNGSIAQRWDLLRGMMDTDGYVGKPPPGRTGKGGKCGTISYATSSQKLRDNFRQLVWSLGGMVSYYTKYPMYTYNGEKRNGHPSYVMTLRFKYPDLCVSRTNKRAERLTHTNQYSSNLKLRIDKVEKIGKGEATCISVKHYSKLYVCENYIVTHNTTIANSAICRINEKVLILVLPKYMDKWIDDVKKYTDIEDSNICTIQGAKTILKLMNATKSELSNYKVYIASITTMNYLISDYESGVYTYPMDPTTFSEHLGVGVLLNDETHQHFHALLKVSLYMNVNQIIGLSATLDSNKSDMRKMYERMFPPNNRISNIIEVEKYTNVKAVQYGMNTLRGIRYVQGKQGYSHIVFEQSIIRNSLLTDSYFEMIYYYVKKEYLNRKEHGERLLVFFSTVIMCTMFTNYLKDKHPELDIRRYCQDDPYENVIEAEISVSTVISASTAVDIPKLITVINTISMASLQANIQTMGRLRKIPGREVWYIYTYNPDIPNQKTMHRIRRDTIMFRSKVIYYETYPKILRNY